MPTYKIKKEKDRVMLEVSVVELTRQTKRESVSRQDAFNYLLKEGIPVERFLSGPHGVSNNGGPAATGTFTFSRPGAVSAPVEIKKEEESKKDLTPHEEPVIIEAQPKKRKRVKRDSNTGNKTTS
jgi:hypothetical protein